MLIVGAYLIKKRLDVAPGVKKFMDLLMAGGVSAMIVGVLFGSYFAIPYEMLPPFLQSLRVLDPLTQLTEFLIICLILGVTQVFFGVLVAAVEAFRRGDPATAIFEQLSTIFLFAMIAVAVVVPGAARWALVIGLGVTMLMQGRAISVAFGDSGAKAWDRGLGVGWLVVTLGAIVGFAFTGDWGAIWAFVAVSALGMFISKTVRTSVRRALGRRLRRLRDERVHRRHPFVHATRRPRSFGRARGMGLQHPDRACVEQSPAGFFEQGGAAIAVGRARSSSPPCASSCSGTRSTS